MSNGLAPSKSTVYVGNLPFSLTNCDLSKVFEKYGKVVKVTVLKDKRTRKSKGVAFVLFLDRESAQACVTALNRSQMFGRTLNVRIANDNGRAPEFIRRREYPDKSRCFECGEEGHLSYKCPRNLFGDRIVEKKKKKKLKKKISAQGSRYVMESDDEEEEEEEEAEKEKKEDEEEEGEDPRLDSWTAAVSCELLMSGFESEEPSTGPHRRRFRPSGMFSDEEELE